MRKNKQIYYDSLNKLSMPDTNEYSVYEISPSLYLVESKANKESNMVSLSCSAHSDNSCSCGAHLFNSNHGDPQEPCKHLRIVLAAKDIPLPRKTILTIPRRPILLTDKNLSTLKQLLHEH